MSQDVEQRIRERAYQIWQEKGCPEGSDYEHWLLAEQEVAAVAASKGNGRKAPAKATASATKAAAGDAPKPAAERKPRARKATVTA